MLWSTCGICASAFGTCSGLRASPPGGFSRRSRRCLANSTTRMPQRQRIVQTPDLVPSACLILRRASWSARCHVRMTFASRALIHGSNDKGWPRAVRCASARSFLETLRWSTQTRMWKRRALTPSRVTRGVRPRVLATCDKVGCGRCDLGMPCWRQRQRRGRSTKRSCKLPRPCSR